MKKTAVVQGAGASRLNATRKVDRGEEEGSVLPGVDVDLPTLRPDLKWSRRKGKGKNISLGLRKVRRGGQQLASSRGPRLRDATDDNVANLPRVSEYSKGLKG